MVLLCGRSVEWKIERSMLGHDSKKSADKMFVGWNKVK